MAYVGRYLHQQRSEIRAMTMTTLREWISACNDIVKRESASGDD
jgi:hypothetical protein